MIYLSYLLLRIYLFILLCYYVIILLCQTCSILKDMGAAGWRGLGWPWGLGGLGLDAHGRLGGWGDDLDNFWGLLVPIWDD